MFESGRLVSVRWKVHLTVSVLLLLWIGFWYRDTLWSMIAIWSRSATFTHGFIVIPISIWLIWRKREQLSNQNPHSDLLPLIFLAALTVIWGLGALIGANVVMHLAVMGIIVASVVAVVGTRVARQLMFPLAFLFFAVPTGEFLLPMLMQATADFTVVALRLTGIPVHREGLQFVIPSGNWSVVEACSGIRYLIASVTIGSLFAYLNYKSRGRRLLFVAISILVPIVANWVRAYLIVMIGHLSNNRLAAGVDHLIYGWVFFGFVLICMFMIGMQWSDVRNGPTTDTMPAPAPPPESRPSGHALRWVALTAAVVVLVPPLIVHSLDASVGARLHELVFSSLPRGLVQADDRSPSHAID